MLAVQGPRAREIVQAMADAPLPARFTTARRARSCGAQRRSSAGPATRARTASSCCCDPADAPALWDELARRGAAPAGLAARDTLRLEVCFHLYGNDLMEERGPIEAGLGWCCKEDTGFIGSEAVARRPRGRARARSSCPFTLDRRRHRAPGQPGRRRRRGDQRHPVAVPGRRHRHGLRARRARAARHRARDRRARQGPPRRGRAPSRSTARRTMADASYPDDLLYHPEHDWVRLDGDTATFGITWYAQDALGEVVFFEPPEVGSTVSKDEPYAEVESVKAVSDVIAPLSGEIVEVNTALSRQARGHQRGSLRRRLAGPGQAVGPQREGRPAGRRRVHEEPFLSEHLHVRHPRGPRGDAGRDRRRVARGALRPPDPGRACACERALDLPAGMAEQDVYAHLRALAARQHERRGRDHLPRAPACTTTTSRRSSTCSWGARSS